MFSLSTYFISNCTDQHVRHCLVQRWGKILCENLAIGALEFILNI